MDTLVSVIIPVFNREKTIGRCVDSVLNQSLDNIEVIVVNDGSDDKTLTVLETIKDDRVKIISQKNMGQGYARNRGLEIACGKYVAFVDSDDTIEPQMLEDMYMKAEAEKADVVQCNLCDIYPDGRRKIQLKYKDITVKIDNKGVYMDKYFSTCRHSYEICNKLIRRSFMLKNNLKFRDTRKYFSEDLLFNLEMINCMRKICFISESYYNYYQNDDSHLHTNNESRLASIFELFMDYIKKADRTMKSAASYTAAMVIIYNIGWCVDVYSDTAEQAMASKILKKYIISALHRKCKLKHRVFLTAIYILPTNMKLIMAKKYSKRWTI